MRPGQSINLYTNRSDFDRLAIEGTTPATRVVGCSACDASEQEQDSAKRCVKPLLVPPKVRDEDASAILVIGDWPTKAEAATGGLFGGPVAADIRQKLNARWHGDVVYDFAVKCPVGKSKPDNNWVSTCRPYLARTLQFRQWSRVFVFGRTAAKGVLGRSHDAFSAPSAYAWLREIDVPVFLFPSVRDLALNTKLMRDTLARMDASLRFTPPRPPFTAVTIRIDSDAVDEFTDWAGDHSLSYDVETSGRIYDTDFKLLSLSIYHSAFPDVGWCFYGDDLAPGSDTANALLRVLYKTKSGNTRKVIAHNAKFESQVIMRWFGIDEAPELGLCTMLATRLLKGDALVGLEVQQDLVGMGGGKAEMAAELTQARAGVVAEAKRAAAASGDAASDLKRSHAFESPDAYAYGRVRPRLLLKYNAKDALSTALLADDIARRFGEDEKSEILQRTWYDHMQPLERVVTMMERRGVAVVRKHARDLQSYFQARLDEHLGTLNSYAQINWNSQKQIGEFFYDTCGLTPPWTTDSGAPSCDKHALAKLANEHPAAKALLDYRKVKTLSGTYAWGFERFIQDDGRIHTSYKIHGTETGRFSSAEPNLQNIPKAKSDDGKRVKDLILASPGRTLVGFDYSTLEIRIAAALSGDREMLRLLRSGIDFHLATARLIAPIFNVDPTAVTKEHWLRDTAKTLNFALLYGKGDESAAESLNITVDMAANTRTAILGSFAGLARWIKGRHDEVRKTGGVWIRRWRPGSEGSDSDGLLSRWRPVPEAFSRNRSDVNGALRVSVNTPVQGGGAEITNAALYECQRVLTRHGLDEAAWPVLQVHDQIVFDVDLAAVQEVLAIVSKTMTSFGLAVPLEVDASVGDRFGSMESVKI